MSDLLVENTDGPSLESLVKHRSFSVTASSSSKWKRVTIEHIPVHHPANRHAYSPKNPSELGGAPEQSAGGMIMIRQTYGYCKGHARNVAEVLKDLTQPREERNIVLGQCSRQSHRSGPRCGSDRLDHPL